jgi:CBS domain-containing protein
MAPATRRGAPPRSPSTTSCSCRGTRSRIPRTCRCLALHARHHAQCAARVRGHGHRHGERDGHRHGAAGGIGVLHKNMSIDRQAAEVDRVKRSESGMILNPITLSPDASLREAVALMMRFKISGVPVVDPDGQAGRHHHQSRPAVRAHLDRPLQRGDDQPEAGHRAGGHHARRSRAISASIASRSCRWWTMTVRAQGADHRQGHPQAAAVPDANKDQHGRLRVAAAIGAGGDYLDRARRSWTPASTCSSSIRRTGIQRGRAAGHRRACARPSPRCSWWPATWPRAGARRRWWSAAWTP